MKKVNVVILNWNGWGDTLECLESLFRSSYDNFRVIVCDNGSGDGSLERIKLWAGGQLDCWVAAGSNLRRFSAPPVEKPIPYVEYDREEAQSGGEEKEAPAPLVLVQTGANLGFAGGNNVGLRYTLERDDFDYVWLLNNDTVVAPDSLSALVKAMADNPRAGMCGSTLLHYDHPALLQAQGGGALVRWKGVSSHIASGLPLDSALPREAVLKRLSYVVGASMLVSRAFLHDVGLMNEEYFLYMEELDWAQRARGRYEMDYAPASRVYHKEGASIGSDSRGIGSPVSQRYLFRNRLLYYRKHDRQFFPLVVIYMVLQSAVALLKGRWERFGIIWDSLLHSPDRTARRR